MQNGTTAAAGGRRGGGEGWGDFSSFVAARWTALVRTAYLLTGDFHEAEDLVQVTLAKVYPHWGGLRTETADAYVRRALVNNNRSRHRRRRVVQLLMPFVPDRPAADAGQGGLGERDLLVSLLAGLPERQRAVVVLRYWEDLSAEEVAELLGCSVGTVKSQASRALAKLRDLPELKELALTGLGAER
ncbi:SigE family RNA polymerase sigma factor [Streptacidiphilus anmyonensis]|uniref:SigE family RNA polymerase sigma factor n=1 Tax=Streptacidiphilus anmyonensis TaxID=405782 RepID=UPI0005A5D570|nr:SigE family RNA polymerase sigma factor [Streptacidiphilus anmyonensis]